MGAGNGKLLELPKSILYDILKSDDLCISSEDEIVDMLMQYYSEYESLGSAGYANNDQIHAAIEAGQPDNALSHEDTLIWQACRFAFLSLPCLLKLSLHFENGKHSCILLQMVNDAALYRNILQVSSPYCQGSPYQEFLVRFAATGSLEPRRLAHIPKPQDNEIDFVVHIPHQPVIQAGFVVESPWKNIDDIKVRLRCFPHGTKTVPESARFETSASTGPISIFLQVWPSITLGHSNWEFAEKYAIALFPWTFGKDKYQLNDTWTFCVQDNDRGWHDFCKPTSMRKRRDLKPFLNEHGFLWIRACVKRGNWTADWL